MWNLFSGKAYNLVADEKHKEAVLLREGVREQDRTTALCQALLSLEKGGLPRSLKGEELRLGFSLRGSSFDSH